MNPSRSERTLLLLILLIQAGFAANPGRGFNFRGPDGAQGWSLEERFASLGEETMPGLRLDTRSSTTEWNLGAQARPGLFEPGKSYSVRVRCQVMEADDDAYLYLLIRPYALGNGNSDLGQRAVYPFEGDVNVELRFTIPPGATNYSVQIHTRKKISGLVREVRIEERPPLAFLGLEGPKPKIPAGVPTGAAAFAVELPRLVGASTIQVADFGASPELADNSAAFREAFAKCASSGASRLVVAKGTYRFTNDGPLSLEGLKDFELEGRGSTLLFCKKKGALLEIRNCERVRLKDLVVDWDWAKNPLASLVRVEELDPNGKFVVLKFIDWETFPSPDARVVSLKLLDPKTRLFDYKSNVRQLLEVFKGRGGAKSEWLTPNTMRLALSSAKFQVGQLYAMLHYYYDMSGFSMRDNAHLTLEGIQLYSCPGFGFLGHGQQHHWQLLRSRLGPPPGVYRPVTSTADHLHVGNSAGYFRMEGCDFSGGNDDFINIHDTSAFAVKTGEGQITAINTASFPDCAPGDLLELRNPDFSPSGYAARALAVRRVPQKRGTFEIDLDAPVPGALKRNFVLFNRRYDSGQIIVRASTFHGAPMQRFILTGHDVTFESNVLEETGPFKIETGFTLNSWCEGYGASNVVIRGNTFRHVNPVGRYENELRPAIYMSTYIKNDPSTEKTSYPILQDILIEGNAFIDCPGAIAYACSVSGLTVRGNRIENPSAFGETPPYRGAFGFSYGSHFILTGNSWVKSTFSPKPGVLFDPETAQGVYSWGNAIRE